MKGPWHRWRRSAEARRKRKARERMRRAGKLATAAMAPGMIAGAQTAFRQAVAQETRRIQAEALQEHPLWLEAPHARPFDTGHLR